MTPSCSSTVSFIESYILRECWCPSVYKCIFLNFFIFFSLLLYLFIATQSVNFHYLSNQHWSWPCPSSVFFFPWLSHLVDILQPFLQGNWTIGDIFMQKCKLYSFISQTFKISLRTSSMYSWSDTNVLSCLSVSPHEHLLQNSATSTNMHQDQTISGSENMRWFSRLHTWSSSR